MKKNYKVLIIISCLILIFFLFFKFFLSYILPFVIALVLASLIDPIVNLIEEKTELPRGFVVAIVLFIILIIITLIFIIAVSRIFIELDKLVDTIPDYKTFGEHINWLLQQNENISLLIDELQLPVAVREEIVDNLQIIYNRFRSLIQDLFNLFLERVKGLPRLVTVFFISIIATFFTSKDKDILIKYCLEPFSDDWQEMLRVLQAEIMSSIVGYIRAQLILITNTTIISTLGLLILGSEYAIVISLLAGGLDLIPVIGPSLIYIPWGIINLLIGNRVLGIWLLLIYCIIAAVRQATEPKILGDRIGIHPLATLLSIYLGVQIFGVVGFVVGPFLLIISKAIFKSGIISFIV